MERIPNIAINIRKPGFRGSNDLCSEETERYYSSRWAFTSLLIFKQLPSISLMTQNMPNQQKHLTELRTERNDTANIRVEPKIQTAILISMANIKCFTISSSRERNKATIYEFTGKSAANGHEILRIVEVNGKMVWITDIDKTVKLYQSQVLPEVSHENESESIQLLPAMTRFEYMNHLGSK